MNDHHLTLVIAEPTRVTSDTRTLIDHIATNKPEHISKSGVIACGISDHELAFVNRSMRIPKIKRDPETIHIRKLKAFDSMAFLEELKSKNFDAIKDITRKPNEMWVIWKSFFLDVLNKHALLAKIRVKGNNLPYVTTEVRRLVRQRDFLRKKANKTGSNYLRQASQRLTHKVTYMLRKLRSNYYSKQIEENSGNMKRTWKILKQAMNKESKTVTIDKIVSDNHEITDKALISEAFNEHFSSVAERLADSIDPCDSNPKELGIQSPLYRFKLRHIPPNKVFNALNKLKNGKATGMHNLPNRILKLSKDVIANSLSDLFNACIDASVFPSDFKMARVAPIFKSDDREDLNNYRPISVLPTVARVFERLIYEQLYNYFAENKLLSNEQWGFRSIRSTALALSNCSYTWTLTVDRGDINSAVFLDIKKAFGTIDHRILVNKLSQYGVCDDSVKFFESYISERVQCCSVNGCTSTLRHMKYGVPQGSILGPLLFIIYMNDLPNVVKNGKICMYADDTNLSTKVNKVSDISDQLIPEFTNILNWLKENRLSLNFMKTKFMLIGSIQKIQPLNNLIAIRVNGRLLKRVKRIKYLGSVVDENLTWDDHINYISVKIRRNIGILKRMRLTVPRESLVLLYKTLIEPYFRYCNTVWGYCNETLLDKLQVLQNKAARVIKGSKFENTNHPVLLKELCWLNVRQLIFIDTAILMYRVANNLAPEPISDMYQLANNVHNYNTRYASDGNFYLNRPNTTEGQRSTNFSGARVWSRVPATIKEAQSLVLFKTQLKEYLLDKE